MSRNDESTAATETRVGHVKHDDIDIYVGRGPGGRHMLSTEVGKDGWLGNPYPLSEHDSREEVVERFRDALQDKLQEDGEFAREVSKLSGQVLGCWCQRLDDDGPLCHAEVIAEEADKLARMRGEFA